MWSMQKNKWLLLLFLVLTMSLAGCQENAKQDELIPQSLIIPEEVRYKTIQAERTGYAPELDNIINGKTYEYPVGEYLTWNVENSRFSEVMARSGIVSAGEVLATFDVEASKADLAELQLQLERQQNQMADGKAEREAAIAAAKADLEGLTSYEREIAELELEKLQAAYEKYCYQTERNLSSIRKRINELVAASSQTTLTAPADGQVSLEIQTPKAGDAVAVGTTVFYFKYRQDWFLAVGNDIPYNSKILFYNKADFEEHYPENLEEAKLLYTGTVITSLDILPDNNISQRTWVKMDTECTPEDLSKTIMFVPAEEIQGLISVPGAIEREGDKRYVNVLEDNVIKKRYVIWGPGETVLNGLTEGQTLILD